MAKQKEPKKRGAKDYFTGSRFELLNQHCDEYISLRGKSRAQFWHDFYKIWWSRYPWRLPDSEEPPLDDPKKMEELAEVGDGSECQKGQVEQKLRSRISAWFSYHASARNLRHTGGPWSSILSRAHQSSNSKPRRCSPAQQLMFEMPEVINAAFVQHHGDAIAMDRTERMNIRNRLAKELVSTTYKHLVPDLEKRARENNERDVKEWGLQLGSVKEAEDVGRARDTLFSAVHPLLELIGRYSGCYVSLIAAGIPENRGEKPYITSIHYFPHDRQKRKNWVEYNRDSFKRDVARPFLEYINWMDGITPDSVAEAGTSCTEHTATPSPSSPPPAPSQPPAKVSQQPVKENPGRYKSTNKRKLASTEPEEVEEEEEEEEEDVDMDIDDNSSSGSSVASEDLPNKRLRFSGITTRSISTSAGIDTAKGTGPQASQDTGIGVGTPVRQLEDGVTGASPDPPSLTVHPTSVETVSPAQLDVDLEIPAFLTNGPNILLYLSSLEEQRFTTLLQSYLRFESMDHSPKRGTLCTTYRPNCVGWWVKRARRDGTPPFDSLKKLSDSIVGWWISLQPEWRDLECGKVNRVDGGDWETLYQAGVNGLLNVIMLAFWWGGIMESRGELDDPSYTWYTEDVTWVLARLTDLASEEA